MGRVFCSLTLITILSALPVSAGTGTADLLMLCSPGFPEQMMLGPAGRAIASGPLTIASNPALLQSGFSAAGGRWNLSTTSVSFAGAFSAGELICAGGIRYIGKGGLVQRDETGQVTGEYSFSSGFAGAGVSFPLTDFISCGISGGSAWETVGENDGSGFAANAGTAMKIFDDIDVGLSVTGFGQAPSWNGSHKDMPIEISFGLGVPFARICYGFAGIRQGLFTADLYGGGLKFSLYGISCSGGYQYATQEGQSGLFGGLSYSSGSEEEVYTISLAFSQSSEFSWPVLGGLTVSF